MRLLSTRNLIAAGLCVVAFAGAAVEAPEPAAIPGDTTVRLINGAQYTNVVRSLFGSDIRFSAKFPPMRRVEGLVTVGSSSAVVTPALLDTFEQTGRQVAAQVVDERHRTNLIPCAPKNEKAPDGQCASEFLAKVGRTLYRRSLTSKELEYWTASAASSAEQYGDFYAGLSASLAGMLVSPQFIFFTESTEPDPAAPGMRRLNGPSKAMRISMALWNTPPDERLIVAGETGDIHRPAVFKREIDRLIGAPEFRLGVRAFFEDMLVLETFDELSKDGGLYPAFTLKVAIETREQLLRIIEDHLVARKGDYRDLFTTRNIFLSQDLAALYRVPVKAQGSLSWVPYELPADDARIGILAQPGFLAINSHPGRSSPTRRGKALRELFMCQRVPDPPPNVDFSNFEDPANGARTARARLDAHSANPVCAGCHKITDPIGLSLEQFDGAGQFRTFENGAAIDPSGSLDGVTYNDAKGLASLVRNHPAVVSCVVDRFYKYSHARGVAAADRQVLKQLQDDFEKASYSFPELARAMVSDKEFFAIASVGDEKQTGND